MPFVIFMVKSSMSSQRLRARIQKTFDFDLDFDFDL